MNISLYLKDLLHFMDYAQALTEAMQELTTDQDLLKVYSQEPQALILWITPWDMQEFTQVNVLLLYGPRNMQELTKVNLRLIHLAQPFMALLYLVSWLLYLVRSLTLLLCLAHSVTRMSKGLCPSRGRPLGRRGLGQDRNSRSTRGSSRRNSRRTPRTSLAARRAVRPGRSSRGVTY